LQAHWTAPNNPWAHHVKAQILRAQLQYEEAILEYETVIALDRNFADAYAYLAWCKLVTGSLDEVIALEEKAIRLSPHDPIIATWYFDLGALHLLQSRTGEAIVWLEKARNAHPGYSFVHRWLAAALACDNFLSYGRCKFCGRAERYCHRESVAGHPRQPVGPQRAGVYHARGLYDRHQR
jgi:tetratricopeptide (TPR) repeat protein